MIHGHGKQQSETTVSWWRLLDHSLVSRHAWGYRSGQLFRLGLKKESISLFTVVSYDGLITWECITREYGY